MEKYSLKINDFICGGLNDLDRLYEEMAQHGDLPDAFIVNDLAYEKLRMALTPMTWPVLTYRGVPVVRRARTQYIEVLS